MVRDMVAIVAAASTNRGIGYQGDLPWKLPGDMKYFKRVTTATKLGAPPNVVVMGRKTWESIPSKFRPLSDRTNVVVTRHPEKYTFPQGVLAATSLANVVKQLESIPHSTVFVIGGAQLYQEAINKGYVHRILYTSISNLPATAKFDVYFPNLSEDEWECRPVDNDKNNNNKENGGRGQTITTNEVLDEASGLLYQFLEYVRRSPQVVDAANNNNNSGTRNKEEDQYLDLCRDILATGTRKGDRTGTGTLSTFGRQMRFSLRNGRLPLLTTKRTFWRGVAEELLWFISGSTNANVLAAKGIHIWDGNGSRDFLDRRGLSHREEGDLGPVYGFQWRHFGAPYVDMHADYKGQGYDQLAACIDAIKNNPDDRRIIMSAWNPSDLHLMALPPCHMFCQFYVNTATNELSCQMYQRSADMGLGVPFNIASYALLTHLVAHVTGRLPGDFVHTIGDAHIYLNHVEAIEEQLQRTPKPFPTLKINPDKTSIEDFVLDDLEVIGYNPHKTIKMKMAV